MANYYKFGSLGYIKSCEEDKCKPLQQKDRTIERYDTLLAKIKLYIDERMRKAWIRANGDIDKNIYKELSLLQNKIQEFLKEV